MKRSHEIHVEDFGISRIVFDGFDGVVWIEPVALLEYPGAGNCMVNMAVFLMGFLEESVKVVVFRHIALDKSDGRAQFTSCVDVGVDIAEDDECAVLH